MPFDTLIQQSNPSATTQVPAANGTAQPTPEQALSQVGALILTFLSTWISFILKATFPNGTRPKQVKAHFFLILTFIRRLSGLARKGWRCVVALTVVPTNSTTTVPVATGTL